MFFFVFFYIFFLKKTVIFINIHCVGFARINLRTTKTRGTTPGLHTRAPKSKFIIPGARDPADLGLAVAEVNEIAGRHFKKRKVVASKKQ